jgi:uncharacterized protein
LPVLRFNNLRSTPGWILPAIFFWLLWTGTAWSRPNSAPDNKQTLKWVMLSANQGNVQASENLAVWYYFGESVPPDYATAVKWLKRTLDSGSPLARKWFSDIEFDGMGSWSAREKLRWLRFGAAKGNLKALETLGEKLFKGQGLLQDFHEALNCLIPAAEKGSARAQYLLWIAYTQGAGVSTDTQKASAWLKRSAEQSFPEAQLELGRMNAFGSGVPQNDEMACKLLRAAAQQGNAQAKNLLWTLLQRQRVESWTDQEEREWIRAAAEMGNPEAQTRYGDLWFIGENMPVHLTHFIRERMAVFWYLKAGRQGNPRGQYKLAQMFSRGDGVETSFEKAFFWTSLAARQNFQGASDLKKILIDKMSTAQLSQAKRAVDKIDARAQARKNRQVLYLPPLVN